MEQAGQGADDAGLPFLLSPGLFTFHFLLSPFFTRITFSIPIARTCKDERTNGTIARKLVGPQR